VLNGIEITGEFIAELEYLKQGVEAMKTRVAATAGVSANGGK
jgi:hypothetical protein